LNGQPERTSFVSATHKCNKTVQPKTSISNLTKMATVSVNVKLPTDSGRHTMINSIDKFAFNCSIMCIN